MFDSLISTFLFFGVLEADTPKEEQVVIQSEFREEGWMDAAFSHAGLTCLLTYPRSAPEFGGWSVRRRCERRWRR